MKRACIVNLYGIGNAVFSIPLIKALKELGYEVTAYVNKDRGTKRVYKGVADHVVWGGNRDNYYNVGIWTHVKLQGNKFGKFDKTYQITPAHGPSNKAYMWRFEKHEVVYLMDIAKALGYKGEIPTMKLTGGEFDVPSKAVAICPGYYRGEKFSASKHWGDARYLAICKALCKHGYTPIVLGDMYDSDVGIYISGKSCTLNLCNRIPLKQVFALLSNCKYAIGNDTGLMHVHNAYSEYSLMLFMEDASNPVKNKPWNGGRFLVDPSPKDVWNEFRQMAGIK